MKFTGLESLFIATSEVRVHFKNELEQIEGIGKATIDIPVKKI